MSTTKKKTTYIFNTILMILVVVLLVIIVIQRVHWRLPTTRHPQPVIILHVLARCRHLQKARTTLKALSIGKLTSAIAIIVIAISRGQAGVRDLGTAPFASRMEHTRRLVLVMVVLVLVWMWVAKLWKLDSTTDHPSTRRSAAHVLDWRC